MPGDDVGQSTVNVYQEITIVDMRYLVKGIYFINIGGESKKAIRIIKQ